MLSTASPTNASSELGTWFESILLCGPTWSIDEAMSCYRSVRLGGLARLALARTIRMNCRAGGATALTNQCS